MILSKPDHETYKREDGMREQTIALCGNPNVGKSTLFNTLTGLRQHTGNWPGKTVSAAEGRFRLARNSIVLIDLPGTYSLFTHSPEEEAAKDYILSGNADAIIIVCDATALERNLLLVFQVTSVCPRAAVAVNLMDEAERKGIHVDLDRLAALLHVPVVGIAGQKKRTLAPLLEIMKGLLHSEEGQNGSVYSALNEAEMKSFPERAHAIAEEVISQSSPSPDRFDRQLDSIVTGSRIGYPLMAALLAGLLWLTIRGTNIPSQILSEVLFALGDRISGLFLAFGMPRVIHDALIFGVYRVLAWVISVMLPPMAVFFPLFTLLEDVGYLPRLAFNLDKPFQCCGACGKQALTMAMGLGCNAVGVTGCRIIDSPRERMLAILTNSLMPCNGRFPILITLITLFIAAGSPLLAAAVLTLIILLGVSVTLAATKLLSHTILKGESSFFTLELPPYRKPNIGQILVRSLFDRTLFVLRRAMIVAAPAGLLLWILSNVGADGKSLLALIADFFEPLGRSLGMDGAIMIAFLLSWPANETFIPILLMVYLSRSTLMVPPSSGELREILLVHGWTASTAVSVVLFTMMHWPCAATVLTIFNETGSIRKTAEAVALPTACGVLFCCVFKLIGSLFLS